MSSLFPRLEIRRPRKQMVYVVSESNGKEIEILSVFSSKHDAVNFIRMYGVNRMLLLTEAEFNPNITSIPNISIRSRTEL